VSWAGLHRALLALYPRGFRERFAADMQDVFAARLGTRAGVDRAAFACFTCADVIWSALVERFAPHPQYARPHRRSVMSLDAIRHDVRFALRLMRREPRFTALTVLALALGIGATTAIFSVVYGVLVDPLPYREPSRLVMIWSDNRNVDTPDARRNSVSPANFVDYKRLTSSFSDMQAMYSFLINETYTDAGVTDIVPASVVDPGMFALLGRSAALGRTLATGDTHAVVLSDAFWTRRYGRDPNVIGRTIRGGGGQPYEVVGVMPPDFVFPYKTMLPASGFTTAPSADLWEPLPWNNSRVTGPAGPVRTVHYFAGVARLKPGVTPAEADADLKRAAAMLERDLPATNAKWSAVAVPLADQTLGDVRPALLLLLGGVGVVLLIICANVANLVLSRAVARQRELAVRVALGATARELARQSVVESFVMAIVSGAAATAVFLALLAALRALAPPALPRIANIGATPVVFAALALLTLVSGALVAIIPMLAARRVHPHSDLKDGGRGTTGGRAGRRARSVLVVAELALAVMLTVAAGLLLRSFTAVLSVDPGFAADRILTAKINAPDRIPPAGRVAFYDQLFAAIEAVPGVTHVGATTRMPLGSTEVSTKLEVEGREVPPASLPEVEMRRAQHDYFEAMGIPLLAGRAFTDQDTAGTDPVAIVSQSLAARLFPDGSAVGRHVRMGPARPDEPWMTIVGVIGDVHHTSLEAAPKPEFYISGRQGPPSSPMLAIRAAGDPGALAGPVRDALRRFDPSMPLYDVRTMAELRSQSIAERRFLLTLVALFGGLALLLAVIGVYGVMAISVSEQTQEVGVRLALGATVEQIFTLVVGRAVRLGAIGVAIGVAGAGAVAPLLASQLFGVRPFDLPTVAAVCALLLSAAVIAALAPARRAMRVDPTTMLRAD
jgi:putative ABC transport system permease protein